MKAILLSLLVLGFITVEARNTNEETTIIKGKVVEKVNGTNQPMALAFVYVENSTICTYTNQDGSYTLNVPKGKYTVKVSFKGYKSESKILNTSKEKEVDFNLAILPESVVLK